MPCWVLIYEVFQEGPHVLVHFLRVTLGDPVACSGQHVGLQPARHEAAADGLHQPLFQVGVVLTPQQQGGRGQLLGLQGDVPAWVRGWASLRWSPPELCPPRGLTSPEEVAVVVEGSDETARL